MHAPKKELSFFTLLLMISFASVNGVLFTPALPNIAAFFFVSEGVAQQTVTWFLFGYTLGQLLYGPPANRFGRKPVLYMGVGLQIFSSFLCIIAGWLHLYLLLLLGRFLLGLGSAVGLKMAFTLLHEFYEPEVASQKISYLMMAFAIGPGLAVALGGILNAHYGWESCFYAGALYGIALFLLLLKLPETLETLDYAALQITHFVESYRIAFKTSLLTLGGFLMGFSTIFFYLFAAVGPFVAIKLLGMRSDTYGMANLVPPIGLLLGLIGSGKLSANYSAQSLIRAGILLSFAGCVWMLLAFTFHLSVFNALFLPMTLIQFGLAFIMPNASAVAMQAVEDKAHASAAMNFINMGTATVLLLILSYMSVTTLLMPVSFIVFSVALWGLYQGVIRSTPTV